MTENCIKKLVTASEDLADLNQVIIRDRSNEKSNKTSVSSKFNLLIWPEFS